VEPPEIDIPRSLQWAAQNFAIDRITAEVVTAFEQASIDAILLKGPTIATWLYAHDQPRPYGDSDLLVRQRDWSKATTTLQELGFVDKLGPLEHPRMESGEGHPWVRRRDDANVDLHCSLFGLGVDPDAVWEMFASGARRERIGGAMVLTPSHPARLLHIALHAVQHGGEDDENPMVHLERRPMVDLERAISQAPLATWEMAVDLAAQLQATAAFAAGLELTRDGRRLAESLGIQGASSVETTLRLEGVPMAEGFAELSSARGFRRKARLILSELFPNPSFMRWWTPVARRAGLLGLTVAYAWRLLWLVYRALPGYLAWRRARRDTNQG
jgi:hypothetical protein